MASRCFFLRDAAADAWHQSKAAAAVALEQLHHGSHLLSWEDANGMVHVKTIVSKHDLKQMVAAVGDRAATATVAAAAAAVTGSTQLGALARARSRGGSRYCSTAYGGRLRRRAGCMRAGSGSPACRASLRRSTERWNLIFSNSLLGNVGEVVFHYWELLERWCFFGS